MASERSTAADDRGELLALIDRMFNNREVVERPRLDSGRPIGMGPAAWKGCDCATCRSERRQMLGSEAADRDQQTLGGWSR